MIRINIVEDMYFKYAEDLKKEFPDCHFILGAEDYEASQVLWGNPDVEALVNCTDLKWIQTLSAGIEYYARRKEEFPSGVLLSSATGAYNLTISEYMLACQLTLGKNLHMYRDRQKQALWKKVDGIKCVHGSTVVIVGMGAIGTAYAKLVHALGGYVIGVRRNGVDKPDFVDEICLVSELDSVLPRADVVAAVLPATPETKNMIDASKFDIMKDGAMFINVGRGNTVDTEALVSALQSGKLSGAALDVTNPEPLPKDHILWTLENVIITPHTCGEYDSAETINANYELFKENLHKFIKGEKLTSEVDLELGYRKI